MVDWGFTQVLIFTFNTSVVQLLTFKPAWVCFTNKHSKFAAPTRIVNCINQFCLPSAYCISRFLFLFFMFFETKLRILLQIVDLLYIIELGTNRILISFIPWWCSQPISLHSRLRLSTPPTVYLERYNMAHKYVWGFASSMKDVVDVEGDNSSGYSVVNGYEPSSPNHCSSTGSSDEPAFC